jgi:hypothetical protein
MDREREAGLGLSPAQLALSRDGSDGVLLTAKSDPSTIERMCCAEQDPPVLDEFDKAGGRETYTYCPVWQAEKDRIAAGREMLAEQREPEPVSMGVSSASDADPWASARRDLDLLVGG